MSNKQIVWLSPDEPPDAFPDTECALNEPDGLLAAGGDLSSERLLAAYSRGIFPWYDEGQPILWWSPDPRCILRPAKFHVAKRLRQSGRASSIRLSFNRAFGRVIRACAAKRKSQPGTWITADMVAAYEILHTDGWAHSAEVWDSDRLIGGIYGLAIGKVFFGESMFSQETNASKFAMLGLCHELLENNFALLDCQVVSQHLLTLGAETMPRAEFAGVLRKSCRPMTRFEQWPEKTRLIGDLMPK